jgi:HEAT repeat protein/nucleoside phosphorylase/MinD-like ATPase involved in chromosome partitioning or flagellar assembly
MKRHNPKIITFYSYKGGVGRSMALANTAYLLAKKYNFKVIIVDWDLEAPGLHRYFGIKPKDIKKGLIDLFHDFKELLRNENTHFNETSINIDDYLHPVSENFSSGSISILPAGKFDEKLGDRVNKFDWNNFYKVWHGFGFIEFLKKELKKRADFVLIDSRTGLSDIAGICTLQLPDIVVLLFSFNEQNLHGTKFICDCISNKSEKIVEKNESPKIILVPSRIESYLEIELLQKWELNAVTILKEYFPKNETALYIKEMTIPYIGYYNFGERLAVSLNLNDKVAESIEKLTKMILEFSSLLDVTSQLEARILDAITIQETGLRNKILLEMVSELKEETTSSDLAKSILKIALDELKASANEELKTKTLKEIAAHVHLVDINELLSLVKGIQNEDYKASILISITNELLDSNAIDLLNIIKDIKNENLKADLLIKIINEEVNHTRRDSVIGEILDLALGIRDESSKVRLLIELLPSQSLSVRIVLIEKILNILSTVRNYNLEFRYLRQMVSYLKSSVEKDLINDLLKKLLESRETEIRKNAVHILGEINSEKAILILIETLKDSDYSVRTSAAKALGTAFQHAPDRQKAWNDLCRLTKDENSAVRAATVSALGFIFSQVPDKQQAWNDLRRLTKDKNSAVRHRAVSTFVSVFSQVPDKQQAWNDLLRLTKDENSSVRSAAVSVLGSIYSQVPDKQQAWNDFHRLTNDENSAVRSAAISALGSTFSQVPNIQQAWNDLHRLTVDKNSSVRSAAASALGSTFSQVPDRQQAWNDLCRLTNDENSSVRSAAISALGSTFSQVPDRQKAWNDLCRLTNDENSSVRSAAASALGYAFSQVPDKQQAWNDLHRLTNDESSAVRAAATSALSSIFSQAPDKQQIWNDLHRLTNDEDNNVRVYANHSLGKVSIFKASQAEKEEDYKKELEKAIEFFEKATNESIYVNPSKYCLPFYRSFHTILFKKQESREEVDIYLAEAKNAIKSSRSKELLFEVMENLANALKEVQNLDSLDLEAKKYELSFYRKYCDRAAELITNTDKKAPFATEVLRKGMPILDRNLKGILEEIREKAKTAYQLSQGTATEEIAYAINRRVQKLEISNQDEMTGKVEDLIFALKSKIPNIPENKRIFEKIEKIKSETDLIKQYELLIFIISVLPQVQMNSMAQLNINTANDEQTKIQIGSITQNDGKVHNVASKIEEMKPTIGVITALPKEYAAVNILLENKNEMYKIPSTGAGQRYCLGEIPSEGGNRHSLVLANADIGNNTVATRTSLLLEHFPNIKSIIMVGIAGGVPNPKKADDHVRLGDIIVSNESGIIQYDLIKQEIKEITHRNFPRPPSTNLMEAVRYLEAEEILGNRPWEKYINKALSALKTIRPSESKDVLYNSDNQEEVIQHPEDPRRIKYQPRVFIGPIAAANGLQKDPKVRDKLREKFKVKAIEMEASGIADASWNHEVGYLVVRGICDYCDSHKNDEWQQYAAIVAAAYTRALIESMP